MSLTELSRTPFSLVDEINQVIVCFFRNLGLRPLPIPTETNHFLCV